MGVTAAQILVFLFSITALWNDYIQNPLLIVMKYYMRIETVVSLMSVCFWHKPEVDIQFYRCADVFQWTDTKFHIK